MPAYKTPGVYVEEISTLPPSVAEVSTAIPAFLGYTEEGPAIARVTTLLEYEDIFGGPAPASFTVTVDAGQVTGVTRTVTTEFLLYYAVSHYFKNGGGACYIISIGSYGSTPAKIDVSTGLGLLEKEDEPTLVVLTDAVNLAAADYHALCEDALAHCHKLGDRFAIFDVHGGDVIGFRNNIGTSNLAYGAAYHPYLQTSLSYAYAENGVTIQPPSPWSKDLAANLIKVSFTGTDGTTPTVTIVIDTAATPPTFTVGNRALTITAKTTTTGDDVATAWTTWKAIPSDPKGFDVVKAGTGAATLTAGVVTIQPPLPWSKDLAANSIKVGFTGPDGTAPTVTIVIDTAATTPTFTVGNRALTITAKATATGDDVATAWTAWKAIPSDPKGFDVVKAGTGAATLTAAVVDLVGVNKLGALKSTNTALYNQIKARLTSERVVLPPSAAVAGVYASVDRDRGVWKAPANVSVSAVIGPMTKITDEAQDSLNVDTAGKSINAIRAFTGKGTLVWGARTLAGNDNEWRYVPVRRLFIMIEESSRKATSFAVFEPNDMTTWLKVRGMIESFLYGLWERGALAGPTPAAAYYVNVGLGKTMTTQDILEGRMIVEIGVAAVRPAEFIILRFSHKLQQA